MKKVPELRIGCSGFYNRHWKNIFYPDNLPQSQWFNFYAEHFNTVELNTTFYRFPTAKSLNSWYKKSPTDFMFSVKAPRLITHLKKLDDCDILINDFYAACSEGLKNKLGYTLFQFPPSIQFSEERLNQIINSLDNSYKNVVEFRHKSWWTQNIYNTLAENKIVFCSVNHPKLPGTIVSNAQAAYIRLHGNPEIFYSNYSEKELVKLKNIILKKDLEEVYIYFNNTASTAGVLNAQQLAHLFRG